jgi:putative ABC transport system permease protein
VLVVAAGLMWRGLTRVAHADNGFDPNGLLTLHVSLPFEQYQDEATRAAAFDRIVERLGSVPGARVAATVTGYPSSSMGTLGGGPLGARVPGTVSAVTAILRAAGPEYFAVMRTAVLSGRAFTAADRAGAPRVAIVTESLAREYWSGEPAVGNPLVIPAAMTGGSGEGVTVTVVGVVADMRLGARAVPSVFVPMAQQPPFWTDVVVRATADPAAITRGVKRALLEIDSKLLIEQIEPMTTILADRLALDRTQSALAALFGALATLLSAVGLYGLLTHLVADRVQEIGVRRAMGAQRSDILRLVLSRGLTLAGAGAAVGTAGALALQRILGSRIFGLSAFDARVVVAAATGLIAVALVACYLPARRAMRIDPMVALH